MSSLQYTINSDSKANIGAAEAPAGPSGAEAGTLEIAKMTADFGQNTSSHVPKQSRVAPLAPPNSLFI